MPNQENFPGQELHRPTGIRILSYLFLFVGLFHFLKFSLVILSWSTLGRLPLTVHPFYLAADGLMWCGFGLIIAWGLWTGKRWSSIAAIVISSLFGLIFWVDKIWIAEPEGLMQRWPVNLILTITGLGMILIILSRKSSRGFLLKNPAKIP